MFHTAQVVGLDGTLIGTWMEGNEQAFRVRLQDGRDAWLRTDAIADEVNGRVTLVCYASGIGRWQLDRR